MMGVETKRQVRDAIEGAVADLDAVADVLLSQAVHGLLRGDAGVAAPTLAATGSGDSGLPAIDFPTDRARRHASDPARARRVRTGAAPWRDGRARLQCVDRRGAASERWVGRSSGPGKIIIDVKP